MLSIELDYNEIFSCFVAKRKIRLLRHLFSLPPEHWKNNTIDLFKRALELEASDIAALIYREFFRMIRDTNGQDEEIILTSLVASFNKNNAMIDFKCYLIR
jgi:hypothetical protein